MPRGTLAGSLAGAILGSDPFVEKLTRGKPRLVTIGDSINGNAAFLQAAPTSITASGVTATVTRASHSIPPGSRIHMVRIDQPEYNGVFRVASCPDANTFTYTMASAPSVTTATFLTNPTTYKIITLDKKSNRDIVGAANMLLGQRFLECINVAVGGERTDETIARLGTEIIPQQADLAFCHVGYNDVAQDYTYAQITANLRTLIERLIETGTIPIMSTIVPFDSGASNYSAARSYIHHNVNRWLRDYCAGRPNVILVDLYAALVDYTSATGNYATNMSQTDKIHPSDHGALTAGRMLAAVLRRWLPPWPISGTAGGDAYATSATILELHDNVLMTGATSGAQVSGTGSSGVLPPQYSGAVSGGGSQTAVYSVVPRADGKGNAVRIVLTGGGGTGDQATLQTLSSVHSRVSAGQSIVAEAEISVSSASASLKGLSLEMNATIDGIAYTLCLALYTGDTADGFKTDYRGRLRTAAYTIPAGVSITAMRARCILSSRTTGPPIIAEISDFSFKVLATGTE